MGLRRIQNRARIRARASSRAGVDASYFFKSAAVHESGAAGGQLGRLSCQQCASAAVDFLADIAEEYLADIITNHVTKTKGSMLLSPGANFEHFYAIKTGAFKSFGVTADGREQVNGFYFASEIIGGGAAHPGIYLDNLQALNDSCVYEISYNKLCELSSTVPALQNYLIMQMSRVINHLSCIPANATATEKLSFFLLDFIFRMHDYAVIDDLESVASLQYHLPMSRADIGNFLGLSAETITRSFTLLKQQNILSCSGKVLIVHDINALEEVAEGLAGNLK